MKTFRKVAISVASTCVASTLIGLGLLELINPAALGAFTTWGYPDRFRVLLAVGEIGGGVLLLVPRVAWYSAALLGILLAGAISTHLWTGPSQLLWPAGTLLVGVAITGYVRHPGAFTRARLRAVADAVAAREIAQQRRPLPSPGKSKKRARATSAKTRPAGRAVAATHSASHSSRV